MFNDLIKYKHQGQFQFYRADKLEKVCNAPNNKSGIYLVYALDKDIAELIYIGRSGKVRNDGFISIRKAGLGGIKDRIVNGHQFGKIPRRISWPKQMLKEKIEILNVHWYITHNDEFIDCPRILENKLLKKLLVMYGHLPRWNNEL